MAKKLRKPVAGNAPMFPPEANEEFGEVSKDDLKLWREKLTERFGFGKGKFKPVEEPAASD